MAAGNPTGSRISGASGAGNLFKKESSTQERLGSAAGVAAGVAATAIGDSAIDTSVVQDEHQTPNQVAAHKLLNDPKVPQRLKGKIQAAIEDDDFTKPVIKSKILSALAEIKNKKIKELDDKGEGGVVQCDSSSCFGCAGGCSTGQPVVTLTSNGKIADMEDLVRPRCKEGGPAKVVKKKTK